jgi:F-type H+-transporting ATPase subunit delta
MSENGQARHATVLDDVARRVAGVYAEALLNAAEKKGQADEVLAELEALVGDLFRRDPHLEAFFSSTAVGRARKEQTIRDAFDGRASELLVNFLLVLNSHNRLELLRPAADAYRELYDRRRNRVPVLVRSAVPLTDEQQQRLREQVRAAADRPAEPVLQTRVDPELIGGLVVQVGDYLYDASVRRRLDAIRNEILERSSHEIQSGRDRFSD